MKNDYFDEIEVRLNKYKKVHQDNHRLSCFKMILWNMLFLFRSLPPKKTVIKEKSIIEKDSEKLLIAMVTSGGIGDHLLFANYLYCFLKKYNTANNIIVDVFFKDKFSIAPHIFKEGNICRKYYEFNGNEALKPHYDLILNLAGFPSVEYKDIKRITFLAPEVLDYTLMCERYKKYCRSTFRGNAYGMMRLCELENRRLIQRADIYGLLNISQTYEYPLFTEEDETAYLERLNLSGSPYITIQTGCDSIYHTHVKLWPIERYNTLVTMLHQAYPLLKIVQIGNSGEICSVNNKEGNLINLVNQTSLEQAKVLLKYSLLHIDIEGGMVHLRHALKGGPSIVLFGPTPVSFFGYDDNINIVGEACTTSCYQLTDAWPEKCPKTQAGPLCMNSITAEAVFSEAKKYLDTLF